MKVSGKGIIIILVFLVVIPALIDIILLSLFPVKGTGGFSMSKSLFSGYGRMIPFYIGYLVVAFIAIYLIKQWRKSSKR